MNANIVAMVFVIASVCATLPFIPRGESFTQWRILIIWFLAGLVAFSIPSKLAGLAIIAVIFLMIAQIGSVKRVYLFLGCFAALPSSYSELIPFPGLNYLVYMQFAKLAAIIILGPVFISAITKPAPKILRNVDHLLIGFVLLTGIMSIRDVSFTSMLRATVDQFILIYIPYIAITRTLTKQEHITGALKAIFLSILIYAMIAIISTIRDWNFYAGFGGDMGYKAYSDFRNGFLRVTATLAPSLLGLIMGFGISLAYLMQRLKAHPRYYIYGFVAVFSFIIFVTGARGGWLAGIIASVFYLLFTRLNRVGRRFLVLGAISGVVVLIVLISQESSLIGDSYGSFNYRAELLRTSFVQIADKPLFGSVDFMESARFAHLRQGEGIIDLVNGYLEITLFYGLFGLSLFLGAHLSSLRGGLKLVSAMQSKGVRDGGDDIAFRTICLLMAGHIGYLAMLATISATSYTAHYGYVFLSLLVVQVRVQLPVHAPAPRKVYDDQELAEKQFGQLNDQEPELSPTHNA